MDTDKQVATPIPFVRWFRLLKMQCHIFCRALKTKMLGVTAIGYQFP